MSAKSLLRYKTTVGGNSLINSPPDLLQKSPELPWQPPSEIKQSSVKMSSSEKVTSVETGGNRRLEEDAEDSFDEGIDDILAQVCYFPSFIMSALTHKISVCSNAP